MTDNIFDLSPINSAQYWEAQADMWHANYADAHKENEELRSMLLEFVKDPLHQLRMTDTGVFGPHFVLVTKGHVYKVREKLGIPKDIPSPDQGTIDKYWDEKIASVVLKETGE